jgi:hypothetical protein
MIFTPFSGPVLWTGKEKIMIETLYPRASSLTRLLECGARVQEEADKLDKYFHRITSCLVIVEAPPRHAASHFTSASNSECRARNSASRMSRR